MLQSRSIGPPLLPQSDNVLLEQSKNVLLRGYTESSEVREDYGWRGHYQDESEGFEKAEGVARCIGEAFYAEDCGFNDLHKLVRNMCSRDVSYADNHINSWEVRKGDRLVASLLQKSSPWMSCHVPQEVAASTNYGSHCHRRGCRFRCVVSPRWHSTRVHSIPGRLGH